MIEHKNFVMACMLGQRTCAVLGDNATESRLCVSLQPAKVVKGAYLLFVTFIFHSMLASMR